MVKSHFGAVDLLLRPRLFLTDSDKLFLTLRNQYHCPEQDSNLGPERLSLLDFETWQLRPLGHHGRSIHYLFCKLYLKTF